MKDRPKKEPHYIREDGKLKDEEIIRVPPEYIKESGCLIPIVILLTLLLVVMM